MADYHSLLARAVANLPKPSTPAARQAIYDRARAALINQLRSLKPQLPESDIAREEAALTEAVARLEAENAASPTPAPPPAVPPAAVKPIAPPPRPVRPPSPPPAPRVEAAPPKAPPAAPPIRSPTAPAPNRPVASALAPPIRPPTAPVPAPRRVPAAAGGAEAPQLVAANTAPAVPIASAMAPKVAPVGAKLASGPTARKPAEEPRPLVASEAATAERPDNAPKLGSPIEREAPSNGAGRLEAEPPRPTAPTSKLALRARPLPWIALAVAIGLIGSVAVAAFLLREKPQDLTIKDPTAAAGSAESAAKGQKMAQRVEGAPTPAETPPPASPTPTPSATPTADATPAVTPSPQPTAPSTQTAIPVAARAAMLVADGADTQKPAVSIGSVIWSPAPAIPGQPGSAGVKAEIDIPDLRMHASMVLRKNVDPGLPASHTIDFRVSFDAGSPIKGVKDIALPLMRRDEPPAADALVGVRVKINDGYYLVGLNRADADVARNVDEIATRGWFDFPMQLSDDRIAKLTFEKAAEGEKVVNDALAAWK